MDQSQSKSFAQDNIAWARRINRCWIVHHDLSSHAEAYLDHLAKADPQRLERSCQNAYQLMQIRPRTDDPKPWFYAGLFSLATADEAREFLAKHWLIVTIVNPNHAPPAPATISAATRKKIKIIRQTLKQVDRPSL